MPSPLPRMPPRPASCSCLAPSAVTAAPGARSSCPRVPTPRRGRRRTELQAPRASRAGSATVFSVVLPYSPANLGVGAVLASVAPLSRLPGAATAKRHSLKTADTHPLTVLGAGSLKPGRRKRWFFPEASAGESSPCLCSRVRRLLAILSNPWLEVAPLLPWSRGLAPAASRHVPFSLCVCAQISLL